ncbi:ras GTPase activating protein, putative [Entamoeba invadens IP1]|uniref:Ras GTPase activating protein, putative n=1 Tax=Entamoeba invadens IP1 TaxID=370355 RepID=L7FK24_ENTIV|nr:ras GTPase activating protein, putative [Entamoeba invadens IP1]ELP83941.1 ras GTPase activating protein, putative [Entamoeba invadens IP1]|eukprot:XP_004183287.1 ras GTPase activating protein, putative [Entamoeba invadens IP1]
MLIKGIQKFIKPNLKFLFVSTLMSSFSKMVAETSGGVVDPNPTEEQRGKTFYWDDESFQFVFQHYSSVVNRISQHLDIAAFIGDKLSNYTLDEYIAIIIELFSLNDRILPFIKYLIGREFEEAHSKEELFRQNNLCTRLLTAFARSASKKFLNNTLKNTILKIVTTQQSYEIDETKIQPGQLLGSNLVALKNICKELIESIVSARTDVPKEIRTICNCLWLSCEKHFSDDRELPTKIVGGFLFLRIFCPAIASPENFGLLGVEAKVTPKSRRNLLLVTKVLQNIANQVTSTKEKFLEKTLSFSIDYHPIIKESNMFISTQTIVMTESVEESMKYINVEHIKISKLFSFHQILYFLNAQLSNGNISATTAQKNAIEEVFDIIGVPPFLVAKKTKKSEREMSDVELVRCLERDKIFYRGDSLANQQLVFYVIINNFVHYLSELNKNPQRHDNLDFIDIITLVLTNGADQLPYNLVLDFSWFSAEEVPQNIIIDLVSSLIQIQGSMRDNFVHGYIIHPEKNVKKLLEGMALNYGTYGLLSGWQKLFDIIDDWQSLSKVFGETEVMIPEGSKGFVKREFHAWKVNPKFKAQDRIVLLTFESLLNIEPTSHNIMNEILINEMRQIDAYEKVPHVVFRFNGVMDRERKNKVEKKERTYILPDMLARETLLTQIFAVCFYREVLKKTKLVYETLKKNLKKSSAKIHVCYDRVIVVKKNILVVDIVYASLNKIFITDVPKSSDAKFINFVFKNLKNGGIETAEKKLIIAKEDIKVRDLIMEMTTGNFSKTCVAI